MTSKGKALPRDLKLTKIPELSTNDYDHPFYIIVPGKRKSNFARQSSFNGNNGLNTENLQPIKKRRLEIDDLTSELKSFVGCKIIDDCILSAPKDLFFPFLQDELNLLYVRKCYQDVFAMLLDEISDGREYLGHQA